MGQRLGTLLVLIALAGCGGADGPGGVEDRRAFTSADTWYNPPTGSADFTLLGKNQFAPVVADLQPEAQAELTEVPAKRLTAEEATRFVGSPLPAGGECVLLRAVVLFEGTGGFDLGVRGSEVHVHHGCLGRRPAPMTRKAIVAVLQVFPDSVFVSCSMAE